MLFEVIVHLFCYDYRFHKACSAGKFEVVTLFLAHRADTNAIDSEGRETLAKHIIYDKAKCANF